MNSMIILLIAGTVQMVVGCMSVIICFYALERMKSYQKSQGEFQEVVKSMIENVKELNNTLKK